MKTARAALFLVILVTCTFATASAPHASSALQYNPGIIQIHVTDAGGVGIAGAEIRIILENAPYYYVLTGTDGFYIGEMQSGISFTFWVRTPAGDWIGASTVTLQAGQTTEANFIWNPGALQVRVADADGTGIAGAEVRVNTGSGLYYCVLTDADGYYSSPLQSGNQFTLWVRTPAGDWTGGSKVTVQPGQTADVDLAWNPGTIQLRVTDPGGAGVEGATIRIIAGLGYYYYVLTDASGYYIRQFQSGTNFTFVMYMPGGQLICSTTVWVPAGATITVSCGGAGANTPPTASWKTILTTEGLLALDGSASNDPDGQVVDYHWHLIGQLEALF